MPTRNDSTSTAVVHLDAAPASAPKEYSMAKSLSLPAISPEDGLRRYMQEIQKFPVLDHDEEFALAKRWTEDGDYDAAHKLVTSHLRLVAKIAMGYRGYGLPVAELISEGNIGLMQAVKKFEPDKGFRLSTYAMWWIKASIQEFILRSWSLVKMGSSAAQKRLFFNLRKMKKRLKTVDDAKSLTPDEIRLIAKELDVSEQDVIDMDSRMSAHDQNLNAKIGHDGDAEWGDMLADDAELHSDVIAEREDYDQKRALMMEAIGELNERERDIIAERQLAEDPMTLEELSVRYGVSRERVRQIEARAMEKMASYVAKATLAANEAARKRVLPRV